MLLARICEVFPLHCSQCGAEQRITRSRWLRDAVRRIGDQHEAPGRHLERALRTGV
jgi:hypothetical protein